jgi:cytochrome c
MKRKRSLRMSRSDIKGTGIEGATYCAATHVVFVKGASDAMDDRFNTIAGWTLFAGIVALGSAIVSNKVFMEEHHATPGYKIEGVEEEADHGGAAAAEPPVAAMLASADVAAGQKQFGKCAACHTITPGGANGIGPNLHGTVGKGVGAHAGYAFTEALKSKGGQWTFDNLYHWLKNPREFAPGTKMTFAGMSAPQDRANVIAYLNAQGSNLPFPAAPAAAPAAPAEAANATAPAPNAAAPAAH